MTDRKRCTHCGGNVSPAARFCSRCGMALAAEQQATDKILEIDLHYALAQKGKRMALAKRR